MMDKPSSFTLSSNGGVFREIITPIGVSSPISGPISSNDPRIYKTKALWDTGATNSVITPSVVCSLGIKPVGVGRVNHAGGISDANVYLVNIYLPNRLTITGIRVTECSGAAGSFGVIIGMDIITQGDFAFTNVKGKSMFSFRLPSSKAIDYVQEQRDMDLYKAKNIEKNDLCMCGSGKKFRDCHGKG